MPGSGAILMFHHVGPRVKGSPALTLSPARFGMLMRAVVRLRLPVVSLADLARGGGEEHRLAITFDDAYSDLSGYALPVLRGLGLPATVFAVSSETENRWDVGKGLPRRSLMSATELRRAAQMGFEIGAHSRTHPDLTALPIQAAWEEMSGSAEDLEAMLDRPVSGFAYPGGNHNANIRSLAEKRFSYAVTTEPGTVAPASDRLALPRTMVQQADGVLGFLIRCRIGRNPILEARVRLALGTRLRRRGW